MPKNCLFSGIELVCDPENFSNIACETCYNKLNEFSSYRNEAFETQNSLYECKEEYLELNEPIIETKEEEEKIECLIEEENGMITSDVYEVSFYPAIENVEVIEKKQQKKSCYLCGISVFSLYHHLKRVHKVGKTFDCDNCGKSFNLKNDLLLHMKTHLSIEYREKFTCLVCLSEFLSKASLMNHEKTFHNDVDEIHPCDYEGCNKSFKSRMKFLQHKKAVHDGGKFMCIICNKFFASKQYLRKHNIQCHSKKKLMECHVCGKSFPQGSQFKRHLLIHEEKRFKCEYENCEKLFQFRASLVKHIETVHLSSSISCDQCSYIFPTQRHLNRHISRQHDNTKVKCEVEGCNQYFNRKDYLTNHYRTHKDIDEDTRCKFLSNIKNIKAISW